MCRSYLQAGSYFAAPVNHTSQTRKVVLAVVVKASNLPCTWGSKRGPGLSFPAGGSSGVGIPDLGCYFPVLFLLFPKMDVFPPLVLWKCELCRVLGPNPETAGLGSSCAVKLLALLCVFACLLFPFCITFSWVTFLLQITVKRSNKCHA